MKLRIRDKIFLVVAVVGIFFVIYGKINRSGDEVKQQDLSEYPVVVVEIGGKKLELEVVETAEEKFKGLGGRDSLGENRGMLFLFSSLSRYPFVMRGMKIPLDFLFIRENEIVDIAQSVQADFSGRIVGGVDYDKVIEVNAGWTLSNGVGLGDFISQIDAD
jgi:uncharacterized membrane protein (UPF0127 family)